MKIYSGDFYFWRFVQEIFPFEDLFMEIVPFVRMCSRRFIHWRLKCRRFIPFWKFVHEDLSFENLNRRFLFMEICPLKIWIGDLSLEDLIMEICPLKICLGDFSFWNFVLEIYPFKNLGDLSFENVLGDSSFWKFDFRRFSFLKNVLGDLSFWKFDFRRFFLFEKCFRRFILLKIC